MLELRNINPDEFERWMRTESRARGNRLNHDPEELRPHFDLSRSIAVFEDGQTGGGVHSHWLDMPIPGGTSVGAGVSKVEVQSTHTRRGIMPQMMLHQIDGIHDRGEPLAALFVTESAIYSRFGSAPFTSGGPPTKAHNAYSRRSESPGRIAFIDPKDIGKDLPDLFRRSAEDRLFRHWERDSRAPVHSQDGTGGEAGTFTLSIVRPTFGGTGRFGRRRIRAERNGRAAGARAVAAWSSLPVPVSGCAPRASR